MFSVIVWAKISFFSLFPSPTSFPHPDGVLVPRESRGNQWGLLKCSLSTSTILPFILCNSSPLLYSACACNLSFHTILDRSTGINISLNIPHDKAINKTKACFEPVSSSTSDSVLFPNKFCHPDDLFKLTLFASNFALNDFNWALVSLFNQGH